MATRPADDEAGREDRRSRREKLRAILDLAQATDQLIPLSRVDVWLELGDMLYALGDSDGAIRSYNNALKPAYKQNYRRSDDPERFRTIRGNLGRAYAHEGHHERAEWLLRQCVFREKQEYADGPLDRSGVFNRLDFEHLPHRPTDASELVFSLTHRAERLKESGHLVEALAVLNEGRYLIEPILGVSKHPGHNHDLFSHSYASGPLARQWEAGARSVPHAYAFNFLAKCYRLSCSLVLDLYRGESGTLYFLKGTVRNARRASQIDSRLAYPWAHRLLLEADNRLPEPWRRRLRNETRDELVQGLPQAERRNLVQSLLARVPMSGEAKKELQGIQ